MGRVGPRVKVPHELTSREEEVLALVRLGLTNEEIGERLGISGNGVKYHVSEILSKLGVATREEAARWRPERRWWSVLGPLTAAKAAGAVLAVVALAGLGVLGWSVLKGGGGSAIVDDAGVCAAGSTERYAEAQQWAWFDVYCPGFLPEGFALVRLEFGDSKTADGQTPAPQGGEVFAEFTNEGTGGRIRIGEGLLGNDLFPQWREFAPPEPSSLLYGGAIEAMLWPPYEDPNIGPHPAVAWATSEGIVQRLILADGVDEETTRAIAEGMVRVGGASEPSLSPTAPAEFPSGFLDFAASMDRAMADRDADFFVNNSVYEPWDCGGEFPGPGQGCLKTEDGSGTPAIVIGLEESEGAVYDPLSYGRFMSDWLTNVDGNASDDYGKPLARVEAVADLLPEIEGQAEGENVYSVITTRISDDSASPPGSAGRQVLIFFVREQADGWRIRGLLRALPPFIDPEGDWPGYFDVSELIISWRRWLDIQATGGPPTTTSGAPTATVVSVVTATATPTPPGSTPGSVTPTATPTPPGFATSIAVVDVSSGNVSVVAPYGRLPSWSPDGRLAYIGDATGSGFVGGYDYFVSKADGTGRTEVSQSKWTDFITCPWSYAPKWSADGQWIAHDTAEPDKVIAVRVSGAGAFEEFGCLGRWSHTGTRIVFVDSWFGDGNIRVADVQTGDVETITKGGGPEWSPDDDQIAFIRGSEVWVRELATGDERLLREFPDDLQYSSLSWSPSGDRILVNDGTLTLIDVDDGSRKSLGDGWNGAWSPDGSQIVYSGWPAAGGPNLYLIGANGGQAKLITAGNNASWSPDGSKLVFERPLD